MIITSCLSTSFSDRPGVVVSPGYVSSVSHAQLTMERVNDHIHRLSVSFSNEIEDASTSVDFILRPESHIAGTYLRALSCERAAKRALTVADVYPLNGTAKSRRFKITDFVRESHRSEIQQCFKILNERDPDKKYMRCLVIDFKDTKGGYGQLDEISSAEHAFTAFFRSNGSHATDIQKSIHRLIREGGINFFINEGSLKGDLLKKIFTATQGEFFQNTERGSRLLCQLCEVIMNGFKQGCETVVNDHCFSPNDYIAAIEDLVDKKEGSFNEDLNPPRLLTMYPHHYEEVYSHRSEYYRLITNVFRANHEVDNDTTIITIE